MEATQTAHSSLRERIQQVCEPVCLAENIELVMVECSGAGKKPLVRLYIDKPGGVTIDDCVHMTRQLGDLIDVYIDDIGSYRLEVSSPGPNRPLTKPADFDRFKGSRIRVEVEEPVDGRKRFTGILGKNKSGIVELSVDNEMVKLPMDKIKKARLAGDHGEG